MFSSSSSSYTDRLTTCGRSIFNYWLLIWTPSSLHIQQLSPKMVSDINLHGVLLWASMGFLMPLGVITVRMSHREEGGRRKALVYLHFVLQVNPFISFANRAWFRFSLEMKVGRKDKEVGGLRKRKESLTVNGCDNGAFFFIVVKIVMIARYIGTLTLMMMSAIFLFLCVYPAEETSTLS